MSQLKGAQRRPATNRTAETAWDVAVAGAACVITQYGAGNLLDLNELTYAVFGANNARSLGGLYRKGTKTKCNPLILLGTDCDPDVDAASPVTIAYLKARNYKSIGGFAFSAVGLAISPHTAGANALGGAKHGSAALTTLGHMGKLGCLRKRYADDERATGWIDKIEGMKLAKLGIRTSWTLANVVPGGGLGATIAAMVLSLGADKPLEFMCLAVAADLHYAAQCETTYAGGGPAWDIIRELFTKRAATRLLGKYDVDAIVAEPAGWMAIADKIRLM